MGKGGSESFKRSHLSPSVTGARRKVYFLTELGNERGNFQKQINAGCPRKNNTRGRILNLT